MNPHSIIAKSRFLTLLLIISTISFTLAHSPKEDKSRSVIEVGEVVFG